VVIGCSLLSVCGDSKPSSGPGRVHALSGGPPEHERVGSVELLGREGVELVASVGPEIELGVGPSQDPSTVDIVNDVSVPIATAPR
jgi:hypothetical protein